VQSLQAGSVDTQHAVIDYNEANDRYLLQDLNSAQGTFVNNSRVQNSSVRLTNGDVIRFGGSTKTFEFHTDGKTPVVCDVSAYIYKLKFDMSK